MIAMGQSFLASLTLLAFQMRTYVVLNYFQISSELFSSEPL